MTTHERDDVETDAVVVVEDRKVERTPLPKLQLAIVFLIQFAEPVTATVIYPFVNQFVRETGITGGDETKTGYYAGIVESTFFFSETLTVFAWGWLSDELGRKPVLLMGPLGLALAMLAFGLSKTFWPLVVFRAFQGFFNGNIGVSKSVMAEITDSTNIGDAYALAPLMWSAGTTIGPMLGGLLSNPAVQWPDTFGKIAFYRDYPYFLPCAAASFVAFLSFAISSIAMKETLPSSRRSKLRDSWGRLINKFSPNSNEAGANTSLLAGTEHSGYGTSGTECAIPPPVEEVKPPLSALLVFDYVITILNYGFFSFIDMSVTALIPLVYSTPLEYGGLGMDPFKIGTIMATYGVLNGTMSVLFLGPLVRRYGPTKVYQYGIFAIFVSLSAFPIENILARRAGGIDAWVALVIVIQFAAQTVLSPCYASMGILVIQVCPHKLLMGSANGVAQMATSGTRAFAPAVASSLFSISIQRNWAGGYAVYYMIMVLLVGLICGSRYLPTPIKP
ncbi:major facilitator superfamily domain-containing protein [Ephemerocybe angulata]|uniref:Major facilitator superfamily domain-containing protein n=1 Tax=Ephemerocybe angulata TaxID=980116 RepID=A0A8H6I6L2_9AGAR|nr:major facilitator superfamily domain-containing protein [Tulosesus angulatus]